MSHKRQEAPGDLELVRAFVNSLDREQGVEELGDPAELRRWLAERDLLEASAEVGEGDLGEAIAVREALRAVLMANNGGQSADNAVTTLHEAAQRAGVALRFDAEGSSLAPEATGVDGALGRLLTIVHEAEHDGTWKRLKACPWDTCQWA